jgi:hypothetical protein
MELGDYKLPPCRSLRIEGGVTAPHGSSHRYLFALRVVRSRQVYIEWFGSTAYCLSTWG